MTSQPQHAPTFTVSLALVDGVAVVRAGGELDLVAAPALREHLRAAARLPSQRVVVDLAGVSFCDSVGMSELVVALNRSQNSGGRLVLSGVQGSLERLLYRAGLHNLFERHATWQDAVRQVTAERP
ncbi:STAS domain-containing protein [Nonomuraea sp. NPDC047897]|uniref:STAS domain-containing protein n=1 Tax=Nonomuraea sp. NPDC047897 TaxID=3364346 RepID=UPI0037114A18